MTDRRRIEPGWQVDLGPPLEVETSMLRWSFKDFYLEGFREFAGTVHWTSGMRLKNETGQGFREGIYLAFKANQRYTVPALASGGEVDLAGIVAKDIYRKDKVALNIIPQLGNVRVVSQPKEGPFSVEELPSSGFEFGSADRVFVGVNEVPVTNVGLDVAQPDRASLVLTVVSLDQP